MSAAPKFNLNFQLNFFFIFIFNFNFNNLGIHHLHTNVYPQAANNILFERPSARTVTPLWPFIFFDLPLTRAPQTPAHRPRLPFLQRCLQFAWLVYREPLLGE
jgi:hypothetical protein